MGEALRKPEVSVERPAEIIQAESGKYISEGCAMSKQAVDIDRSDIQDLKKVLAPTRSSLTTLSSALAAL